jgi:hypothetical protein
MRHRLAVSDVHVTIEVRKPESAPVLHILKFQGDGDTNRVVIVMAMSRCAPASALLGGY